MKLKLIFSSLFAMALLACSPIEKKDSVKEAKEKNEYLVAKGVVESDVSNFLVEAADGRLMGVREGKATTQSNKEAIVNYGKWMVKDQTIMLKELKVVAKTLKISLPHVVSLDKREGLINLLSKSDADFNLEFAKMMIIDHERDLAAFKKAVDFKNKNVSNFASKYVSVIENHLAKIKEIKEGL